MQTLVSIVPSWCKQNIGKIVELFGPFGKLTGIDPLNLSLQSRVLYCLEHDTFAAAGWSALHFDSDDMICGHSRSRFQTRESY